MQNADLVMLHEKTIEKLRKEINDFRNEAVKQRKIIFHLERMRNDHIEQTGRLNAKVGRPKFSYKGIAELFRIVVINVKLPVMIILSGELAICPSRMTGEFGCFFLSGFKPKCFP